MHADLAAPSLRWYVVNTKVNAEQSARLHLERQGYSVFLPSFRRTVRHARTLRETRSPLFPSYLFVQFDAAWTRWRPINGTVGVRAVVTGGDGRPAPVPEPIMAQLFARCPREIMEWREEELAVGTRVLMTAGPFANFVGEIQRFDGPGRVRLLLETLGGAAVSTSISIVRPIDTVNPAKPSISQTHI